MKAEKTRHMPNTGKTAGNAKASRMVKMPYAPRYPEVHAALNSRRFAVLVAHRRFGKTVLAVNHLIRSAVTCKKRNGHFAYIAPFRNQAKSVAWDYLKHYTAVIPKVSVNETELSVSLPSRNGQARIRIFGADKPDALRGLYFDGVVMDEVAQMKPQVWQEIVQPALADRQGYAVFIGTPKGINLFSELYYYALKNQVREDAEWVAMSYPCDKTNALPQKEIDRLRDELSDNTFRQEMLCDFTASSDDALILLDEVMAAQAREADMRIAEAWPLVIGVDIARFGDDASVFFPRRGLLAMEPVILRKKSNTDVAARLVKMINDLAPSYVNIDQGQGTGVIDIVRGLAPNNVVISEVPFGGRASDPDKYVNRRSEIWTLLREWLKSGGCLPDSPKVGELLKSELTAPCYSFDAAGRIKLEAKDEIKKRLSHSTDLGDALALTFAVEVGPEHVARRVAQTRQKRKLYDPFA